MLIKGVRFMRLLVFFDLPVKTKKQRKAAQKFRNFLLKDGYDMMQLSVYYRLCRGQDMVNKHLMRLKAYLPPEGNIRALQVTELQFSKMIFLLGFPKKQEKLSTQQLLLF